MAIRIPRPQRPRVRNVTTRLTSHPWSKTRPRVATPVPRAVAARSGTRDEVGRAMSEALDWRMVWKRLQLGPAINRHPAIVFQAAQILFGRGEVRAAEAAFAEVLERDPR